MKRKMENQNSVFDVNLYYKNLEKIEESLIKKSQNRSFSTSSLNKKKEEKSNHLIDWQRFKKQPKKGSTNQIKSKGEYEQNNRVKQMKIKPNFDAYDIQPKCEMYMNHQTKPSNQSSWLQIIDQNEAKTKIVKNQKPNQIFAQFYVLDQPKKTQISQKITEKLIKQINYKNELYRAIQDQLDSKKQNISLRLMQTFREKQKMNEIIKMMYKRTENYREYEYLRKNIKKLLHN